MFPHSIKDGLVLGYDPGGNGAHGTALVVVQEFTPFAYMTDCVDTVEQAITWWRTATSYFELPVLAAGIDTLTALSTGPSGDRPADRELRRQYPLVARSVKSPNGLRGAMSVNGIAATARLWSEWPNAIVTETHPKVLFYDHKGSRYAYAKNSAEMTVDLLGWLGFSNGEPPGSAHAWDALCSAYAAVEGLSGRWTRDLHSLPPDDGEQLIFPLGRKAYYFWPD